ncbi:glycoside hydrolase family 5 protein [Sorangium sp. So ce726]|uniref:glycoside hydrolase family 5 protein n=1 Tax=Sorangium sp. So ce726 TaxID=3133319 RepID=UPI003F5E7B77
MTHSYRLAFFSILGLLVACSSTDPDATSGAGAASEGATGGSGGGAATGDAATGGAGTGDAGTGGAGTGGAGAGGAGAGGAGTAGVGGSGGTGGSATPVDAAAMVPDMGIGANIGNTLENTTEWETGWGQPLITQTFINGMANHGIKTVRVPVAWDTYAANGTIDATKMARVKEVVGWIEAAGMYSIVNIHWDGGWIYNEDNADKYKLTGDVKTKFASYWTQIATAFSDVGHKLILEGMNEEGNYWVNGVHDGGTPDYAALNEMNQLFVTTVREQGGYNASRALLIAGFVTDIDRTCVGDFKVPTDPAGTKSLFLSIHYYTPYTFCGLDTVESWGSPKTTWGTEPEKAELKSKFDTLGAFSTQRSIPIILGEFGVTLGTNYPREPASRTLWMRSVVEAAKSRGVVPVLWDTGTDIKRTDGSFSTEWQAVVSAANQ